MGSNRCQHLTQPAPFLNTKIRHENSIPQTRREDCFPCRKANPIRGGTRAVFSVAIISHSYVFGARFLSFGSEMRK